MNIGTEVRVGTPRGQQLLREWGAAEWMVRSSWACSESWGARGKEGVRRILAFGQDRDCQLGEPELISVGSRPADCAQHVDHSKHERGSQQPDRRRPWQAPSAVGIWARRVGASGRGDREGRT